MALSPLEYARLVQAHLADYPYPEQGVTLFIYGSLQRNQYNHWMMKDVCSFVTTASLAGRVRVGGKTSYQTVEKKGGVLEGEIYTITNAERFRDIHEMELAYEFYPRTVTVRTPDGPVDATVYIREEHRG